MINNWVIVNFINVAIDSLDQLFFRLDTDTSETDASQFAKEAFDPARYFEPYGELGLVLQGDVLNMDVGAPRDPQPGNKGGKK